MGPHPLGHSDKFGVCKGHMVEGLVGTFCSKAGREKPLFLFEVYAIKDRTLELLAVLSPLS